MRLAVAHDTVPPEATQLTLCKLCLSLQDPSRLAFGGGSFAGIAALMAAMDMPHVFGGVLVESPSLWTGEGRFLQVGVLMCCCFMQGMCELSVSYTADCSWLHTE
jgi:hypothetical protein